MRLSLNEFNCPKCGKRGFPIEIVHEVKKQNYRITLKCPKHKTKFEIQDNNLNYLLDLVKSVFTCQTCGNSDSNTYMLGSIVPYLSIREQAYLTIGTYCMQCRKKNRGKYDFILAHFYFDMYLGFLKKQEEHFDLDEYKTISTCPKCENNIIVKEGSQYGKEFKIRARCNGPHHHLIKLTIPLIYARELFYRCEKCNSTDVFIGGLYYQERGSRPLIDMGLLILTCKNCGHNNEIKINYNFYEILSRKCREKEEKNLKDFSTFPPAETEFFCSTCNSMVSIRKLVVKNQDLRAILFCNQKHETRKNLARDEKYLWIDSILSGLKKCDHCWSSDYKIVTIYPKMTFVSSESRETEIKLQCLNCGRNRAAIIDNLFFDEIADHLFKQQAEI